MKHAVALPNFGEFGDPKLLVELAQEANNGGWDGFFLWDHALWFPEDKVDVADTWTTLAAIAVATALRPENSEAGPLRIGSLVTPLARRKPAEIARQVTTIDHLSEGRVTFGIGLGGPEAELRALGELCGNAERRQALDEALAIVRALWNGETVSSGEPSNYVDLVHRPQPLQDPLPIWAGGYYRGKRGTSLVARAATLQGEVFLGVATDGRWDAPRPLTIDEFRDVHDEIVELRAAANLNGAYDFAVWADETINPSPYEAAGATWWVLAPPPDIDAWLSLSIMRRRIRTGP